MTLIKYVLSWVHYSKTVFTSHVPRQRQDQIGEQKIVRKSESSPQYMSMPQFSTWKLTTTYQIIESKSWKIKFNKIEKTSWKPMESLSSLWCTHIGIVYTKAVSKVLSKGNSTKCWQTVADVSLIETLDSIVRLWWKSQMFFRKLLC